MEKASLALYEGNDIFYVICIKTEKKVLNFFFFYLTIMGGFGYIWTKAGSLQNVAYLVYGHASSISFLINSSQLLANKCTV